MWLVFDVQSIDYMREGNGKQNYNSKFGQEWKETLSMISNEQNSEITWSELLW